MIQDGIIREQNNKNYHWNHVKVIYDMGHDWGNSEKC